MKENVLKVPEGVATAVKPLDDRRVGKLFKALCAYAFEGQVYGGRDVVIRSNFTLIKRELDRQKENVENGKLGGQKSLEMRSFGEANDAAKNVVFGMKVLSELENVLPSGNSTRDKREK